MDQGTPSNSLTPVESALPCVPFSQLLRMADQTPPAQSNTTANQIGIKAGGGVAGRDNITFTNSPITINGSGSSQSYMAQLAEKCRREKECNPEFRQIIDKLEHFNTPIVGEQIVGLEEKLRAGGFEARIESAKYTKEAFAKKLNQNLFSETAQKILAHLLADAYSRFHRHVAPRIHAGATETEISDLIQEKVIDPLTEEIQQGNVLDFYPDEIDGILYFLTGNCHLKWSK